MNDATFVFFQDQMLDLHLSEDCCEGSSRRQTRLDFTCLPREHFCPEVFAALFTRSELDAVMGLVAHCGEYITWSKTIGEDSALSYRHSLSKCLVEAETSEEMFQTFMDQLENNPRLKPLAVEFYARYQQALATLKKFETSEEQKRWLANNHYIRLDDDPMWFVVYANPNVGSAQELNLIGSFTRLRHGDLRLLEAPQRVADILRTLTHPGIMPVRADVEDIILETALVLVSSSGPYEDFSVAFETSLTVQN